MLRSPSSTWTWSWKITDLCCCSFSLVFLRSTLLLVTYWKPTQPQNMGLEHEEKPPRAYRELVMVSQAIRCSTNSILIRWSMKRNHLGPRELVMISQAIRCSTNSILIHFVAYLLLRLQETAKIKHLLMSGWAGWSGWPPQLKWFNHVTLSSNMAMEHPENPPCFSGGSQPGLWVTGRSGLSPLPRSPTPGSGPPRYHHI